MFVRFENEQDSTEAILSDGTNAATREYDVWDTIDSPLEPSKSKANLTKKASKRKSRLLANDEIDSTHSGPKFKILGKVREQICAVIFVSLVLVF